MASKRNWPKLTWSYPQPHDFIFGFGLTADASAATKKSTIMPYVMQDNALIDYETIKTNPENADFAVQANPNVRAGSYIPKCSVTWMAYCDGAEVDYLNFKTMKYHTSMLNRLDAFDKITGNTVKVILELANETTDEQCYPLWNTVKLFEGHLLGSYDLPPEVPALTGTQQPEGVAFDLALYFDALHYYTNRQMLATLTDRMQGHTVANLSKDTPKGTAIARGFDNRMPSICKYAHPYMFYGELFHVPKQGDHNQVIGNDVTLTFIEHLTILGRVRFNEYNPDFNFARA